MIIADTTILPTDSVFDVQAKVEADAIDRGRRRYWEQIGDELARNVAGLSVHQQVMRMWEADMRGAMVAVKANLRDADTPTEGSHLYGPYILATPSKRLAMIAMVEAIGACIENPAGASWNKTCATIGRAVVAELNLKHASSQKTTQTSRNGTERIVSKAQIIRRRYKRLRPVHINQLSKAMLDDPLDPAYETIVRIGDVLLHSLVFNAIVPIKAASPSGKGTIVKAFERRLRKMKTRSVYRLHFRDEMYGLLGALHDQASGRRPVNPPMVHEPNTYKLADGKIMAGGYDTIRQQVVLNMRSRQRSALESTDEAPFWHGLWAVGTAANWRVNRRVLRVYENLIGDGVAIPGVPSREAPSMTPIPLEYDYDAEDPWHRAPDEVKYKFRRARKEDYQKHAAWLGEREVFRGVRESIKLWESLREAGWDKQWTPYNFDSRNRVYPAMRGLFYQGPDFSRGLCEFGTGKDCTGERARVWLKRHVAALFGQDKESLTYREQWADDHMHEIEKVAADPEGTFDFWSKADGGDTSWQALAACFALTDPEAAAHFPITLDGTCNGLQHYAALARCPETAALVNMIPATENQKPGDAYTALVGPVSRIVGQDAMDGNPAAQRLVGLVDRALVKQPLMTTLYNVTDRGMRAQILKTLKKRIGDDRHAYESAAYMVQVVRRVLTSQFPRPFAVLGWLEASALAIARAGYAVGWNTPLMFPVEQPYFNSRETTVKSVSGTLYLRVRDEVRGVNARKHARGCPPNYIHSLDGTHNLMNAIECVKRGVMYAPNHDLGATHASTADRLGVIVRQQFAAEHTPNLLHDLWRQWTTRYPDVEIPDPPLQGEYQVGDVMHNPSFWS